MSDVTVISQAKFDNPSRLLLKFLLVDSMHLSLNLQNAKMNVDAGTMLAGWTVMCCGRPRMTSTEQAGQRSLCACVNFFVGFAQAFTVTFCLVGWAWSTAWGCIMVAVSSLSPFRSLF